jgi:hypothetical protein
LGNKKSQGLGRELCQNIPPDFLEGLGEVWSWKEISGLVANFWKSGILWKESPKFVKENSRKKWVCFSWVRKNAHFWHGKVPQG